ncbi:MAG: hypothetical protein PWQ17_2330, partial [Anaerophaga sp.]|nr:hypothetical protein [Anaerophaga sp.]
MFFLVVKDNIEGRRDNFDINMLHFSNRFPVYLEVLSRLKGYSGMFTRENSDMSEAMNITCEKSKNHPEKIVPRIRFDNNN